jgi:hypothetical protein
MRIHSRLLFDKNVTKALIAINEDEYSFIENKALPFENGQEFNDFQHLTPMIWIFW